MEKRILILTFFISISAIIFADEIHKYGQYKVKTIGIGTGEGQIGYDSRQSAAGGVSGPTFFTIDSDGHFYVCDSLNYRINIYGADFVFLRSIPDTKQFYISRARMMKFDSYGNLILIAKEFVKIDKNGNAIFHLPRHKLPERVVYGYDFFPIEDSILFYDKNGSIKSIDPQGKIVNERATEEILRRIKIQDSTTLTENADLSKRITEFTKKNNLIVMGDRLLINNSLKQEEYFKIIRDQHVTMNAPKPTSEIDISVLVIGKRLIGYDKEDNSYWDTETRKGAKRSILIYSKYGEVLDCFYSDLEIGIVAVAPNGDVYFMSMDENGIYFWKTDRRW